MFDTLIEIAMHAATCVVIVKSDVDLANAEIFGRYATEASAAAESLVVSLAACSYIDSSGIRPLLRLARDRGDAFGVVVTRGSRVDRVFELLDLRRRVATFDTLDDALASRHPGTVTTI